VVASRRVETHQRDAGPRHVPHSRAQEAELPANVGGAVRQHEPVRAGFAVVEHVRPHVVPLPQPAVVVVGVMVLGEQQTVADATRQGDTASGQGGAHRHRRDVHEGGGEQAELIGVALRQCGRARGGIRVAHRVEERDGLGYRRATVVRGPSLGRNRRKCRQYPTGEGSGQYGTTAGMCEWHGGSSRPAGLRTLGPPVTRTCSWRWPDSLGPPYSPRTQRSSVMPRAWIIFVVPSGTKPWRR